MFTPKWKSDAKHLVKGSLKFLHYKRDLLNDKRIREIEARRQDLIDALKGGERKAIEEAAKQLTNACENSLPRQTQLNWFEENVEVMFVAIVIALGLRAYYLQPFRIPTGSMQPTLNGITGTPLAREQWPSLPERLWEKVTRGRTYAYIEMKKDRRIASRAGHPLISDFQFCHFFSRSQILFEDSQPSPLSRWLGTDPLRLPAPITPMMSIGLDQAIRAAQSDNGMLRKGQVLCEGYVDTGDLVLVNKFAYHFRKPKRGEVFVFDTLGIKGIEQRSGEQARGAHYIKRLCGVPGDSLEIQSPHLLVNGKIASEPGIEQVMQAKGPYAENPQGYMLASADGRFCPLSSPGSHLDLRAQAAQGQREYAALGDNTDNSLDSRYWGSVKEFNLVGPALFSLWPFTTGHWGFIR